ncbi:MAG: rRNA maturation RNase YbeY [Firmicutes bacterium]|nr:rRNA maturation RNase YbeY [Bacillota bacterium]
MVIFFADEGELTEGLRENMTRAAVLAVEGEGLESPACQLSVSFVSKDEIKDLNRDYRNVDSVTDVLSFPQFERDEIEYYAQETESAPEEFMLGDVVICREKAEEQAVEYGHSFERELVYLFTHSVLHLLGYDHEDEVDKANMRKREEEIMESLGIPRK